MKFLKETLPSVKAVYVFDHNIRRTTCGEEGDQKNTNIKVQPPLSYVHTDYTVTGAPRRMLNLMDPPKENDVMKKYLPEDAAGLIPKSVLEEDSSITRYCTSRASFIWWLLRASLRLPALGS